MGKVRTKTKGKTMLRRVSLRLMIGGAVLAVCRPAEVPAAQGTSGKDGNTAVQAAVIEIGAADLLEDVCCTVGYAYDGQQPSVLGYGWSGYDDVSGVWFVRERVPDTLNQLFMHCPFREGTGVAFADFAVELPSTKRVRLSFEIALRPTAKGSDGVNYRVKADGKCLFEKRCTWKEFRPFDVDLTPYAGTRTVLRLEVDPGPEHKSREDWSLWRNVRLLAGTDQELAESAAQLAALLARRRAEGIRRGSQLAQKCLLPLSSRGSKTACPGLLEPATSSMHQDGGSYVFRCAADETIAYHFDPAVGLLAGLSVSVDGQPLRPAPFWGGPRVFLAGREYAAPTGRLETTLIDAKESVPGRLTCRYRFREPKSGESATMTATLWLAGKSLGLKIESKTTSFCGFTAKPYGGREVPTAFAVGGAPHWRPEGVYVASVADVMQSEASSVGATGVRYTPLTNGQRNPLHDVFYLTVSRRYEETLSNVVHEPSPFLEDLASRVVLDAWGGPFAGDQAWLDKLAVYGVDHLLIIKHVWQRDGYDRTYPNTMPASASQGGDKALRSLSEAAQSIGHRFCVHENFYDYYPNAEDFRPEHCALDPAGKPQRGWDRGPVVASILKPSRLMEYARKFSPEVRRRYACDAAYHDIMPTWRVDFDSRVPDAGRIRVTHEATRALCDYDRELFGGPVVFEAATAAMAGVYDGGCNHGRDTYRTPAAVAYELLKVHPKMSNHGFGYYERWLPWGYNAGWNRYVMTDRELDKYRAYQIAFGRTGFIGQQLMQHPHGVVREYHLMQAFARAYTGRQATRIKYCMDGTWVDAGTAARFGELTALNVEYEGGQNVYVNLADEPLDLAGHKLPPFGTLTIGPRARAWTATRSGQVCDYARYGAITYIDARSDVWQVPKHAPPIQPALASFDYTGGNGFALAIKWKVGRTLDRNYNVFWHFRHDGQIKLQRDFQPRRRATQWQVGDEIVTGPYRLSLKEDSIATAFDVVVGLYDKGGRATLLGGAQELQVGRLLVERHAGRTKSIRFEPTPPVGPPGTLQAPYLEGINAQKKVIDFGHLATNGALVAKQTEDGLLLTPVPLAQVMTIGLAGKIRSVRARGADGALLDPPSLKHANGKMWFETVTDAVSYLVEPK